MTDVANPFLPLSFIVGPAILTNASTVLLNGASIRYNLAIGLWRDLQAELKGRELAGATPYPDRRLALELANVRVRQIVRALTFLYGAVAGFAVSALVGLTGAITAEAAPGHWVVDATFATIAAAAVGLLSLLVAAVFFVLESRSTLALLHLGLPALKRS